MTLRLRLVLGLVALVTVGLAIFGVATYTLYSRSEYQRLDDQVQASIPLVTGQLYQAAGMGSGRAPSNDADAGPGGHPRPPTFVPPSTYAELRSPTGSRAEHHQPVGLDEPAGAPR